MKNGSSRRWLTIKYAGLYCTTTRQAAWTVPLVFWDTPLLQNQPTRSERDTPLTGLLLYNKSGSDSDAGNTERTANRNHN